MLFSSKGSLTVQFVLGFALVWGFIALFAVMCFTLAVSSITQYITFASAHALFLGDGDLTAQKDAAFETYKDLKNKFRNQEGAGIFSPDVIDIYQEQELLDMGLGLNTAFQVTKPNLFYGAWTKFVPKVLKINTFFGDSGKDDNFFKTTIGSYLGREPTMEECDLFFDQERSKKIYEYHQNNWHHTAPLPRMVGIKVFDNGC